MSALFGEPAQEEARPKRKARPQTDGAVKRLIDQYHREFLARHGVKPRINGGKDGTLFKQLVAAWGEQRVSELLTRFLNERDTRIAWANWADKTGWTVGAFAHVAQSMMTSTQQQGMDDRTAANVAAARKATGR